MKHRLAIISIAVSVLLTGTPAVLHAQKAGEPITLNFVNAEIEAVARTMAAITGRNLVVDPRVKGTINLSTERPVAPSVAFDQFLATLRLSGYTVVEAAGLYKVVPEADAKLQGGPVNAGPVTQGGSLIVTQIFKLNYETANNLVPVLRPLISPNNTINVNPGNNSLVITDYADNLQRLARIIAALDVSSASDVEVIPLKNAIASDLVPLVQRLIESGAAGAGAAAAGQGQSDTSFKTTVVAESRSNSLILRAANPARLAQVRLLISQLDQPGAQGDGGNIHVVYLRNADAVKLAATLRAALSAGSIGGASGITGTTSGSGSTPLSSTGVGNTSGMNSAGLQSSGPSLNQNSNQPSTGGQIQADPSTNSLIITAPEPQYRQLRAVIDKLDGRRAQVLVESMIAEVNANKASQFGIQWQGVLGNKGDSAIGVIGTNFGTGNTTNIIGLATQGASGSVTPSSGFNFGLFKNINGVYVLGALANFLQTTGDGNVLSTPNLLTLDNEEAKILIGENVPFVTGQYTNNNATGSGTVNPFQTIERKDVGLTLRVKPQINENGTIKMVIYQETSAVKAGTENASNGPTTTKRSIESTVLVDDGSIVVLGGLLQDQYSGNEDKVPGLGDVPVLGNLFKSQSRTRNKTNLMVFLRPVVVRDAQTSEALSLDRYGLMRSMQQNAQPVQSSVLQVNEAPVMPQRAVPAPAAPAAK
ncbi:type II secretion system secretin GspD [Variovorax terrae]|uniref:Type II secretion system secretin GspD n=1 Tax=Variovorax terrae TaxID=2923278 RepID=A0A9X1VXR4_9BURK|nr:type II secretion system secretin GspD [Variovorax terrae]MCJ0764934.1 type II secretion system secretin GspD [Variovorax terrae]